MHLFPLRAKALMTATWSCPFEKGQAAEQDAVPMQISPWKLLCTSCKKCPPANELSWALQLFDFPRLLWLAVESRKTKPSVLMACSKKICSSANSGCSPVCLRSTVKLEGLNIAETYSASHPAFVSRFSHLSCLLPALWDMFGKSHSTAHQ